MKKKIALFLSVLSVVMMLGACGTEDSAAADYNGVTYEELETRAESFGTALKGATAEEVQEALEYYESYGDEGAIYVDLCEQWVAAMEVAGDFVEIKEDSFKVEKSGKTLTTDITLVFEERDVTFRLVYKYHDMTLTGVTVEPVYTLSEKMVKAALNTVICMSIVFAVLIFISLIISCFKIFPYLEAKKKGNTAKNTEAKNEIVTQTEPRTEQQNTADAELVAVIAAAIAAYEGTSTSGFVVRSIRRR